MMHALIQAPDWVGAHSALDPAGPHASAIDGLRGFLWIVAGVVFLAVVIALLLATVRANGSGIDNRARADAAARPWVIGAAVTTVLTLFLFLFVDFRVAAVLEAEPPSPVEVKITGRQWWWEITYLSDTAGQQVVTANELHLPVGRPVLVRLYSSDVIHSFWVPSLGGKRDLIPGDSTRIWLQADVPGTFRGQCAEYCGHQHARMGFVVVAEDQATFDAWLAAQRDSARTPTDSVARRGRALFLSGSCVVCHAVGGTPAGGRIGPNLTHVASRLTLAAGTLANTPENLERWIRDPQSIKPGTLMPPPEGMSASDVSALIAYVRSLR